MASGVIVPVVRERVRVTVQPALEPISLETVKDHLRITGSSSDAFLRSAIADARAHVETLTGRALITQTRTLTLDYWPGGTAIELPGAPLQSVSSVVYTADDGTATTLSTDYYHVDTASEPGRVVLCDDYTWPEFDPLESGAIVITYSCGYGVRSSAVTISIAAPGVLSWSACELFTGDRVTLTTTGALPTGLAAGTSYHVVQPAADTFQLSATAGGTGITTTGTQSGAHTATCAGAPASMPRDLSRAIKLYVGHMYEHREATTDQSSGNVSELPLGFHYLLENWRVRGAD